MSQERNGADTERWLVVHPSDEMYGADRIALEVVRAIGVRDIAECWLPSDVTYDGQLMRFALEEQGLKVRYMPLPVLRRAYLNPKGLIALGIRAVRVVGAARRMAREVDGVYLTTSAVLPMAPVLKRRGLRIVCHVHECWGETERRLLSPLLRFCDVTIAVSHAVADRLPGSPTVVHNGLQKTMSVPPLPSGDVLYFLVASRWSSWKGHREILRAWRLADRKDAHLIIVGGPPRLGAATDVRTVVKALGLGATVTVLPEQRDVQDLIAQAHVVIVPSVRPDPLPTIAIEAMRAGRPVMASDSGGLPEIVQDGQSGWLLPPGDVVGWANGLRAITISEVRRRGIAARERFLAAFDVERFRSDLRAALSLSVER